MEPNLDDGICKIIKSVKTSFNILSHHDKYSSFRGGSNSLFLNNNYYGLGHFTAKRYIYMPFVWQYDLISNSINFSFLNSLKSFYDIGFNIIDPVNIFEDPNGKKYISLDCSVRDWFYEKEFMQLIIPIKNLYDEKNLIYENEFKNFIKKFKITSTKLLIGNDLNIYHNSSIDKYDNVLLEHKLKNYQVVCTGKYFDILSNNLKIELSFDVEKYIKKYPIFLEIRISGAGSSQILLKNKLEIKKNSKSQINLFNSFIPNLIDYRLELSIEMHRSAKIKLNHMRLFWMDENAKNDLEIKYDNVLKKVELLDEQNKKSTELKKKWPFK